MKLFVGRRRETRLLRAALEGGRNVVLTGAYGIGRTALVRHLTLSMAEKWRFFWLDGRRTPGQLYDDLAGALVSGPATPRRETLSFRRARHLVATRTPADPRLHAVVLDDVASVSPGRLDLLRRLVATGRFRLIAVVEAFIPAPALVELCCAAGAAAPIRVGPLSVRDGERFFGECRAAFGLPWSEVEIHCFALATRGFPLAMQDRLARELERNAIRPAPRPDSHSQNARKDLIA